MLLKFWAVSVVPLLFIGIPVRRICRQMEEKRTGSYIDRMLSSFHMPSTIRFESADAVMNVARVSMITARKVLVNPAVTPFYHCISRCVRRAILCGAENAHRKQWIEDRLQELSGIFAIDVCGFSVLDNHLHVLLRLDVARAKLWSPQEIVRRWLLLCPPKDRYGKPVPVTPALLAERARDAKWIDECRGRLSDLGWFMIGYCRSKTAETRRVAVCWACCTESH
jgi:hypothetical protein